MTDYITRQGVIEYIEKKSGMNIPEWLREAIEEAPSAEIGEEECENCRYRRIWRSVRSNIGNGGATA